MKAELQVWKGPEGQPVRGIVFKDLFSLELPSAFGQHKEQELRARNLRLTQFREFCRRYGYQGFRRFVLVEIVERGRGYSYALVKRALDDSTPESERLAIRKSNAFFIWLFQEMDWGEFRTSDQTGLIDRLKAYNEIDAAKLDEVLQDLREPTWLELQFIAFAVFLHALGLQLYMNMYLPYLSNSRSLRRTLAELQNREPLEGHLKRYYAGFQSNASPQSQKAACRLAAEMVEHYTIREHLEFQIDALMRQYGKYSVATLSKPPMSEETLAEADRLLAKVTQDGDEEKIASAYLKLLDPHFHASGSRKRHPFHPALQIQAEDIFSYGLLEAYMFLTEKSKTCQSCGELLPAAHGNRKYCESCRNARDHASKAKSEKRARAEGRR